MTPQLTYEGREFLIEKFKESMEIGDADLVVVYQYILAHDRVLIKRVRREFDYPLHEMDVILGTLSEKNRIIVTSDGYLRPRK